MGFLVMKAISIPPQNELRPCDEPSLKEVASFNLLKKKYDKNKPERQESDEA
jgi:hypothetical protein